MSDFSLPSHVTLGFGCSGSGKTTFAYRYILNRLTPQECNDDPATCVFIFDWKLEAQKRLGIPAMTTAAHLEKAIASRIVIFNPHIMFPGTSRVKNPEGEWVLNDEKMACRWFCKWVYSVAQRGAGKKIIYIDELHLFSTRYYLPPEIARIARIGRAEHLELLTTTQFPRDYHSDLRSSVTEWICFNTSEPDQLDAVRPYFPTVDRVSKLPLGSFISVSRHNGAELAGKVF
jgi:hypothetical protein